MSFGIQNLTNATANASQSAGIGLKQTSQHIFDFTSSSFAGSAPILGLVLLALIGYILFTSDASVDVFLSILIPTTLFLGWVDFLPYSTAVIYVTILFVAGFFAWNLYKFAFR